MDVTITDGSAEPPMQGAVLHYYPPHTDAAAAATPPEFNSTVLDVNTPERNPQPLEPMDHLGHEIQALVQLSNRSSIALQQHK